MSGKLPIDRVRESEQANHPRFEREKRKMTKKESDLQQKARAHDDVVDPSTGEVPQDKD